MDGSLESGLGLVVPRVLVLVLALAPVQTLHWVLGKSLWLHSDEISEAQHLFLLTQLLLISPLHCQYLNLSWYGGRAGILEAGTRGSDAEHGQVSRERTGLGNVWRIL